MAENDLKHMTVTKSCWEGWSKEVGMEENQTKAQLMVYTDQQKAALGEAAFQNGCEGQVVEAFEGFGVVAVRANGCKTVGKEKKGSKEATETLQCVKGLPNSTQEKRMIVKVFAGSSMAYGWLEHAPRTQERQMYDSQMWTMFEANTHRSGHGGG